MRKIQGFYVSHADVRREFEGLQVKLAQLQIREFNPNFVAFIDEVMTKVNVVQNAILNTQIFITGEEQ